MRSLLALLCLVYSLGVSESTGDGPTFDVCVVGAGPGGVQLGHYLRVLVERGVFSSYKIFEQNSRAGSVRTARTQARGWVVFSRPRGGRVFGRRVAAGSAQASLPSGSVAVRTCTHVTASVA